MSQPTFEGRNRRLDRRRISKRTTNVTCRTGTLGLGADLALALLDVSDTGLRLVVKASLALGQEVEVILCAQGQARPVRRLGKVAWSVEAADGSHCVGVHFDKPLSYADLLDLS